MIKYSILIFHFFFFWQLNLFAQNDTSCLDQENRKPILGNKITSENGTSILLRDTCDYSNRIYAFMLRYDQSNPNNQLLLPAIIIDTAMFYKVEEFLGRLLISSKKLRKDFYKYYKNDIKLLIGCTDIQTGEIFIVIQLLTNQEFESEGFYAHSLFLVNQQANLKYLILHYQNNQFKLWRSYPYHRS
jgi:hypothetical protein